MNRKIKSVGLILLMLTLVACADEQAKKLAKASQDIALAIGAIIDCKRVLATQGLISKEENLTLSETLLEVNYIAKQFNEQAQAISSINGASKAQIVELFAGLNCAVAKLNDQVEKLSTPSARDKIKLTTTVISAALAVIQPLLEGK